MNPIRIEIPSARFPATLTPEGRERFARFLSLLRQAGVDPSRAARNPLIRQVAQAWLSGTYGDGEVVRMIRNVAIINPSIRTFEAAYRASWSWDDLG